MTPSAPIPWILLHGPQISLSSHSAADIPPHNLVSQDSSEDISTSVQISPSATHLSLIFTPVRYSSLSSQDEDTHPTRTSGGEESHPTESNLQSSEPNYSQEKTGELTNNPQNGAIHDSPTVPQESQNPSAAPKEDSTQNDSESCSTKSSQIPPLHSSSIAEEKLSPLVLTLERTDDATFSSNDILSLNEPCDALLVDLVQSIHSSSPSAPPSISKIVSDYLLSLKKLKDSSSDHFHLSWDWAGTVEVVIGVQKHTTAADRYTESLSPSETLSRDNLQIDFTIEEAGHSIDENLFWSLAQQLGGPQSLQKKCEEITNLLSQPIQGYHATTSDIAEEEPEYANSDTLVDKLYKSIQSLLSFISAYQEEIPLSDSYQQLLLDYVQHELFSPLRAMILDGLLPPPQIDDVDPTEIGRLDNEPNLKAWKYLKEVITVVLANAGYESLLEERIEKAPENRRFFTFLQCALEEHTLADWLLQIIMQTSKRNLEGVLSYQRFGNQATVNHFISLCRRIDQMTFHFSSREE